MDNNFENNTGNQPQRPFTEKPEQPAQPFGFEPEKPLMQQPEESFDDPADQAFDPIEQTATYQDGAFDQVPKPPQYAQPPQYPQQGFGVQPPVPPVQNNYQNPVYFNGAYGQPPQGFVQPPVQPMQPPMPQTMPQPMTQPAPQSMPQQQFRCSQVLFR